MISAKISEVQRDFASALEQTSLSGKDGRLEHALQQHVAEIVKEALTSSVGISEQKAGGLGADIQNFRAALSALNRAHAAVEVLAANLATNPRAALVLEVSRENSESAVEWAMQEVTAWLQQHGSFDGLEEHVFAVLRILARKGDYPTNQLGADAAAICAFFQEATPDALHNAREVLRTFPFLQEKVTGGTGVTEGLNALRQLMPDQIPQVYLFARNLAAVLEPQREKDHPVIVAAGIQLLMEYMAQRSPLPREPLIPSTADNPVRAQLENMVRAAFQTRDPAGALQRVINRNDYQAVSAAIPAMLKEVMPIGWHNVKSALAKLYFKKAPQIPADYFAECRFVADYIDAVCQGHGLQTTRIHQDVPGYDYDTQLEENGAMGLHVATSGDRTKFMLLTPLGRLEILAVEGGDCASAFKEIVQGLKLERFDALRQHDAEDEFYQIRAVLGDPTKLRPEVRERNREDDLPPHLIDAVWQHINSSAFTTWSGHSPAFVPLEANVTEALSKAMVAAHRGEERQALAYVTEARQQVREGEKDLTPRQEKLVEYIGRTARIKAIEGVLAQAESQAETHPPSVAGLIERAQELAHGEFALSAAQLKLVAEITRKAEANRIPCALKSAADSAASGLCGSTYKTLRALQLREEALTPQQRARFDEIAVTALEQGLIRSQQIARSHPDNLPMCIADLRVLTEGLQLKLSPQQQETRAQLDRQMSEHRAAKVARILQEAAGAADCDFVGYYLRSLNDIELTPAEQAQIPPILAAAVDKRLDWAAKALPNYALGTRGALREIKRLAKDFNYVLSPAQQEQFAFLDARTTAL